MSDRIASQEETIAELREEVESLKDDIRYYESQSPDYLPEEKSPLNYEIH